MFCLQSHYRKPLEFDYEIMDNTKTAYEKLKKKISALTEDGAVSKDELDLYRRRFIEAVGNDLNTALGLSLIYDVLKADINDATKLAIINDFDRVLSLDLTRPEPKEDTYSNVTDEELAFINDMLARRAEAKAAKDFATADAIRQELLDKGIAIKDTREGAVWERV